jgi:hypothetical protein
LRSEVYPHNQADDHKKGDHDEDAQLPRLATLQDRRQVGTMQNHARIMVMDTSRTDTCIRNEEEEKKE